MEVKDWKKFAKFLKIDTKYKGQEVVTIRRYFWRDAWHNTEITLREIGEMTGGQTSGNITNGLKSLNQSEKIKCKFTAGQKALYIEQKEKFLELIKLENLE
jgi:hypothetical protein